MQTRPELTQVMQTHPEAAQAAVGHEDTSRINSGHADTSRGSSGCCGPCRHARPEAAQAATVQTRLADAPRHFWAAQTSAEQTVPGANYSNWAAEVRVYQLVLARLSEIPILAVSI